VNIPPLRVLASKIIHRPPGCQISGVAEGRRNAHRKRLFLAYATDLMQRDPRRAAENASSLLLIGYLIRSFEEDLEGRQIAANSPVLH